MKTLIKNILLKQYSSLQSLNKLYIKFSPVTKFHLLFDLILSLQDLRSGKLLTTSNPFRSLKSRHFTSSTFSSDELSQKQVESLKYTVLTSRHFFSLREPKFSECKIRFATKIEMNTVTRKWKRTKGVDIIFPLPCLQQIPVKVEILKYSFFLQTPRVRQKANVHFTLQNEIRWILFMYINIS